MTDAAYGNPTARQESWASLARGAAARPGAPPPPLGENLSPTRLGARGPDDRLRRGTERWTASRRPSGPIRVGLWVVIVLCTLFGAAARAWLLFHTPVSVDEAGVGVMAQQILHGHLRAFPPGQVVGGTEAYVVMVFLLTFGQTGFGLHCCAIGLSVATSLLAWRVARRFVTVPELATMAGALVFAAPVAGALVGNDLLGSQATTLVCGLACLLVALRMVDGHLSLPAFGLLGLLAGVGWWSSPEVLAFLVPVALLVAGVVRSHDHRTLRALPVRFATLLLTFAVGALPWFWANASSGWASLRISSYRAGGTPGAGYLDRLHLFFSRALPMQLGLRLPTSGRWLFGNQPGAAPARVLLVAVLAVATLIALAAIVLCAVRGGRGIAVAIAAAAYPFLYALAPPSGPGSSLRSAVFAPALVSLIMVTAAEQVVTVWEGVRRDQRQGLSAGQGLWRAMRAGLGYVPAEPAVAQVVGDARGALSSPAAEHPTSSVTSPPTAPPAALAAPAAAAAAAPPAAPPAANAWRQFSRRPIPPTPPLSPLVTTRPRPAGGKSVAIALGAVVVALALAVASFQETTGVSPRTFPRTWTNPDYSTQHAVSALEARHLDRGFAGADEATVLDFLGQGRLAIGTTGGDPRSFPELQAAASRAASASPRHLAWIFTRTVPTTTTTATGDGAKRATTTGRPSADGDEPFTGPDGVEETAFVAALRFQHIPFRLYRLGPVDAVVSRVALEPRTVGAGLTGPLPAPPPRSRHGHRQLSRGSYRAAASPHRAAASPRQEAPSTATEPPALDRSGPGDRGTQAGARHRRHGTAPEEDGGS